LLSRKRLYYVAQRGACNFRENNSKKTAQALANPAFFCVAGGLPIFLRFSREPSVPLACPRKGRDAGFSHPGKTGQKLQKICMDWADWTI
jgi:hypothetical protein